ncbi:SRPBCC domain-containing protein [Paenibacillus xerothermodurans]|uniref:SRPBCC domain-containing protein n=1 Tax=Paenibacillus xerothermodurans TaxID=1977292 RepID=A0A2W1N5V7_PAEXE|nr:SRPBCC domain-containing protein [Paenibacillus xerothermodurans]PZE19010.1 SRPBCC domain-containing protein [Paenibacillus xerothermodurans]
MSTHDAANKIVSKVEGRELTLERIFNAPRNLVFRAYSDVEQMKRWYAPPGWTLTVSSFSFRPGGVWHFCMKCLDENQPFFGHESWGKVVFREIVEPERIVYSDAFSDAEGNVPEGMAEALITLTFLEHVGKTKLIHHAQYPSEEALKSVIEMGMLQGMTATWDSLEKFLEENK